MVLSLFYLHKNKKRMEVKYMELTELTVKVLDKTILQGGKDDRFEFTMIRIVAELQGFSPTE